MLWINTIICQMHARNIGSTNSVLCILSFGYVCMSYVDFNSMKSEIQMLKTDMYTMYKEKRGRLVQLFNYCDLFPAKPGTVCRSIGYK